MSDAAEIRAVAGRVATVAVSLRSLARRAELGSGVAWRSTGAEAYRSRLREQAGALRSLATQVDTVVADLRRYARSVDQRQSAVGHGFHTVVDEFVETVW